eukprot:jgi/Botrbrau1/9406/Bobra.0252s0031.1
MTTGKLLECTTLTQPGLQSTSVRNESLTCQGDLLKCCKPNKDGALPSRFTFGTILCPTFGNASVIGPGCTPNVGKPVLQERRRPVMFLVTCQPEFRFWTRQNLPNPRDTQRGSPVRIPGRPWIPYPSQLSRP